MKPARNKPDSEVFRDVVWGVEYDAFEDDVGRSLIRAWSLGAGDDLVQGMIHNKVRCLQKKEAFGELSPFREPKLKQGEITLGHDGSKKNILALAQWLNAGLLILGNTGAAKSNLVQFLSLQLAKCVGALWITDMYKTQMRHLRPLLRRLKKDLVVARLNRMKINPLQADRSDPRGHLPMILDILQRVLDLPSRAMTILRAVGHELYNEFGIYRGRKNSWPCLYDAYERVRAADGLNAAAKEALLDRLGAFLVALTPEVGAYRLAWRPSDLSRHFIVFEANAVGEQVKSVVLNYALFSVLRSRIAQGRVNPGMDFWCVFEDAQRFFSTRTTSSGEITPAEELAGLIRGTGTGIAFTAQTLAGLPNGLLPNLASKCMCRLGGHSDYQALGADMGMNHEQIQWAKLNLRPGTAIWQLSEGPWRRPFVSYTPRLNIPHGVTDGEADKSLMALDALPTVPASEFRGWQPRPVFTISSSTASGSPDSTLSDAEWRFLDAVIANPGRASSAYAKLVGISGKRAAEIRVKLVKTGFLREHRVATGQRGRSAILLEPLDPGIQAHAQFVR